MRSVRPSKALRSAPFLHLALAFCVACAGGCSTLSGLVSSMSGSKAEDAVPMRRAAASSATPVPTAPAGPSSSDESASGATATSAPLTIPRAGGTTGRRSSLIYAANGDSRRVNDNGLTEGGGNISQVSFAAEGGDYAPDVDRTGSFMVFASTQHRPTFDIYRKSVDGRTVTQLTTDPSDDLMPSIAPDGTKIAFASNRNGNWDIYTLPITGGAPTQITFDADEEVQPTWAPDGRRLAFSRKNGRTGTWEIWIVDSATPGLRTFVCEGFLPRWSPVEERDTLLFQRARQRGSRLYGVWTIDIVKGEGMNPTEIVSAKNAAILQPSWSPDGQKIVFTTVVSPDGSGEWPEQSDIWIVNADGTGRIGLTNSRFRNMQPCWGANGKVYFVSNRGGSENIWAIAVDGARNGTGSVEFAANAGKKSNAAAETDTAKADKLAEASSAAAAKSSVPDLLKADTYANVPE
ncbi:MAG: TolB family protein [bacterium]